MCSNIRNKASHWSVKSRKAMSDTVREGVRSQMVQSLYNLYTEQDGKPLEDFQKKGEMIDLCFNRIVLGTVKNKLQAQVEALVIVHMRDGGDSGEDMGTGSGDYGHIWKDLLVG